MSAPKPTVAVWNNSWLPWSQTFIANQVGALSRYHPMLLGLYRTRNGLPIRPERAPFSYTSILGKTVREFSRRTNYVGVYDGLLSRARAALIHAHFGPGGVSAAPIARRLRLPLAVTFHGYDVHTMPYSPSRQARIYRSALPALFEQAALLVCVSDALAQALRGLGAPDSKIRVLHTGIPVPPTSADGERAGVVFVGRLIPLKGANDLVEAMALLPVGQRTHLTIIGEGPQAAELVAGASKRGVDLRLTGRLTPIEVNQALANAALFAGPSHHDGRAFEAFGMTFLEAAAHGLPVVGYRHAGVMESVADEQTGILVPEGDIDSLSAAIGRLLSDPELAEAMGRAGRKRVENDFDIVDQTAALEDLYDEVLAGR